MPDKRKNTIADVAALAGVSVGTVSNVLNGKIVVSEARRQRVLGAVRELGYTQNMLAMGLRRKRSPVVGICVPTTTIHFFSALIEAFEEVGAKQGYEVMQVLSGGDPQVEYQRIQSLLRFRVGGLLFLPSMHAKPSYDLIAASRLPTVVVERAPDDIYPFDRVTFDHRGAMEQVVRGLIERGHRDVLFVVREVSLAVNQRRIEGLRAASRAMGVEFSHRLLEVRDADETAYCAILAAELQRGPQPSALVVSNTTISNWTLRGLRMIGLRCPDDISLLSFEHSAWDDIVDPPVSSVVRPTQEMARAAWTFLMRRMNAEEDEPPAGIHSLELKGVVNFRASVRSIGLLTKVGA